MSGHSEVLLSYKVTKNRHGKSKLKAYMQPIVMFLSNF